MITSGELRATVSRQLVGRAIEALLLTGSATKRPAFIGAGIGVNRMHYCAVEIELSPTPWA